VERSQRRFTVAAWNGECGFISVAGVFCGLFRGVAIKALDCPNWEDVGEADWMWLGVVEFDEASVDFFIVVRVIIDRDPSWSAISLD